MAQPNSSGGRYNQNETPAAEKRKSQGEREQFLTFSQKPRRRSTLSRSQSRKEKEHGAGPTGIAGIAGAALLFCFFLASIYWVVVLLYPADEAKA